MRRPPGECRERDQRCRQRHIGVGRALIRRSIGWPGGMGRTGKGCRPGTRRRRYRDAHGGCPFVTHQRGSCSTMPKYLLEIDYTLTASRGSSPRAAQQGRGTGGHEERWRQTGCLYCSAFGGAATFTIADMPDNAAAAALALAVTASGGADRSHRRPSDTRGDRFSNADDCEVLATRQLGPSAQPAALRLSDSRRQPPGSRGSHRGGLGRDVHRRTRPGAGDECLRRPGGRLHALDVPERMNAPDVCNASKA